MAPPFLLQQPFSSDALPNYTASTRWQKHVGEQSYNMTVIWSAVKPTTS